MKPKMFEELLGSVHEGGAILRGQKKPSRRFEVGPSRIRAIRERTSLSQSKFATLVGAFENHCVRAAAGGEGDSPDVSDAVH
jgi:DNA-binding transcriptional regulator YiaG